MKHPPLHHYRLCLPLRSVRLQCLDDEGRSIKNATASGFIVKEKNDLFLYTCWHVVTGFDMHNIKIPPSYLRRGAIQVMLQDCQARAPGVTAIGGNQSITIPLYTEIDGKEVPIWIQEKKDTPNTDLNNINIKVPAWHDVVKIPLPREVAVSETQILQEEDLYMNSPLIGDKLYVVGYPYGYSSLGTDQPTPVVVTRFLASDRIKDRTMHSLLDGPAAPGMSGGPVFVEKDERLFLTGIYTGLIYPDHVMERNEKTTALGIYCNMIIWWKSESAYAITSR